MRAASGNRTGVLDPNYTPAERDLIKGMRSRINIARAVLKARLDDGLTQDELGKAAGTKQSRVSEIEAMKGNPRFDTLDRIAGVLGLAITLVPREGIESRVLPRAGRYEHYHVTASLRAAGSGHIWWSPATRIFLSKAHG